MSETAYTLGEDLWKHYEGFRIRLHNIGRTLEEASYECSKIYNQDPRLQDGNQFRKNLNTISKIGQVLKNPNYP